LPFAIVALIGFGGARWVCMSRRRWKLTRGANQITVHAGCQTLGNGESETGAIVCGVGAVHLGELNKRLHELLLVFLGDADAGVGNGETECPCIRGIGVGS